MWETRRLLLSLLGVSGTAIAASWSAPLWPEGERSIYKVYEKVCGVAPPSKAKGASP